MCLNALTTFAVKGRNFARIDHNMQFRWVITALFLLAQLAVLFFSFPVSANAGCSNYMGRATINEVFRQSQGRNNNAFTEVKRLDNSITSTTYNSWEITLCRSGGDCITEPLSKANENLPWMIMDDSVIDYTYYDISGGMDVLLTDSNGDIIDYVSIANWTSDSSYLTACNYFFDTTANENEDNTFDIRREPDGSGDWSNGLGNSSGDTSNDTNDGDSSGPAVSVPATLTVLQGLTAQVIVSLDKDAPRGGVTIDFELHDGSAVGGTDYTIPSTLNITIPEGSRSGTIDISTILTTKVTDSFFYLVLTGATNAYITSQLTTITIQPVLIGLWHFDETTWDGTSGEVTDNGIHGNNGTSRNGAHTSFTNPALGGSTGTCRYGVFDGNNDYVRVPDDASLDFDGDFTVAAWVNPGSLPTSGYHSIISKDTNFEFHLNSSGEVYWWWQYHYTTWWGGTRTSSRSFTSSDSIATDTWSHVAIVYSKSTDRQFIYINGNLAGTANYDDETLDTNNHPLYIGGDIDSNSGNLMSGRFFDGSIDEVHIYKRALTNNEIGQVYQQRHPCSGGPLTIDHLRLLHDGNGLTCEAENITLRACSNSDCSTLYTDTVTVALTSPSDGWNNNPITFSNGEAELTLAHTTAETITLDATAQNPPSTNSTRCFTSAGTETCSIVFADTGIIIDGDDSDLPQESVIKTQIAGKPSNTGFNASNILIRAVKKDDNTQSCVAALQGKTLDSEVSYSVTAATPAIGLDNNTITVSGNNSVSLDQANTAQTIQLTFDGNGTAPLSFTSYDAGSYVLNLSLSIPVTDSGGSATGTNLVVTDSSNDFTVRPLAVFADVTGNTKPTSSTDAVLAKTGEPVDITFKSLRWTAGRDTNNDGIWDSCGNNTLTDPGSNYAAVPSWNIGQPQPIIQLPSGGSNGTLNYTGDISFGAETSTVTANNTTYNEVGIIQLEEDSANPFLGETVKLCSPNIGRFIPAYFTVSDMSITNRINSACIPASAFTYIGEDLQAKFTLTARNSAGVRTNNYIDSFARFNNDFNLGAIDTTSNTNLSTRLSTPVVSTDSDWLDTTSPPATANGQATFSLNLYLNRGSEEGPYDNFTLGIDPQDLDNVVLNALDIDVDNNGANDHSALPSTILRFGQLQLRNAYGPQTSDLDMPLVAEYHNGTDFIENSDDSCTILPTTSDVIITDGAADSLDAAETTVTAISSLLSTGIGTLTVSIVPPKLGSDGNDGCVVATLDVTSTTPWLQPDGDDDDISGACDSGTADGIYDNNPDGIATFGMYRGDDRFLLWREAQ